jgi:two-component SAPR family response regulator
MDVGHGEGNGRHGSSGISVGGRILSRRVGRVTGRPAPRPADSKGVSINYMGKFFLEIDGTPVRRWRAGRAQRLFQYLAMRHDQPVASETLNEVLWPGAETRQASGLKVAVHALREVLATAQNEGAGDERGSGLELVSCSGGYILETKSVSIDFEELAKHVDFAKELERRGESGLALDYHRAAAECYRGDFLDGESDDWVYSHREWLKDLTLRSLERLADDAVRGGDYESAINWCHRMLDIEPCREETYRVLMVSHGRLGRLGRVKCLYELCCSRLRDELDVEPDTDTQRLFARAVRGGLARSGRKSVASVA